MKVLMISSGSDTSFFEKGSPVRERMKKYAKLVDELHIIVFTPRGYKKEQINSNLFLYPTNSFSKIMYVFDAIKQGKKILSGKDFIITAQDPFEAGLPGMLLSRKFKVPLEIQIHGDIYSPFFTKGKFFNRIRRLLGRTTLSRANRIRVVSQRIKNSLIKKGTPQNILEVLPIVVSSNNEIDKREKKKLQEKFGDFRHIILMVARLEQEKRIDIGIDAFSHILEKHPHNALVIVGEGRLRSELETMVKQQKLSNNIFFEGWKNTLAAYYDVADIFLNTSLHEGYARTLVEAASFKLPIITTDVGLVGDILHDGESALVCKVKDVRCITHSLEQLIQDRLLCDEMGDKAYRSVQTRKKDRTEYLQSIQKGWEECLNKQL